MPQSSGDDLKARILADIRGNGPMPVDRFMEICVADPVAGYWQRTDILGTDGDFITAPEISQVFGELIGLWCAVTWAAMGKPRPLHLIELGPGRGTLMRDIQRVLARAMPECHGAVAVHLVELSHIFRRTQAETLAGATAAPPRWHNDLADVPAGPAIILGNEFLDALPVRQWAFDGDVWRERVVRETATGGALEFALGEPVIAPVSAVPPAGSLVELRPGEEPLLAALAARKSPLAALFIDYGPAEHTYGDTLQAVRRHAYVDPLAEPGTCDLTAHVQFAGLIAQARQAGLTTDGPLTQAEFLGALGLAPRTSRLMAANPSAAAAIELAAQRLVAPTGMGSLFKVVCLRTPDVPSPPPWGPSQA